MGRVIAVDFDDVLVDTNTMIAEFHNKHYGTNYTRADVHSYSLYKVWGVTKEESVPRFDKFIDSEYHDRLPLVVDVRSSLAGLRADGWKIVIITARPGRYRARTEEWLKNNLDGQFDDLVFTDQFMNPDSSVTKASVAAEHGAQVLIEDAPRHAEELSDAGVPVLLFDSPWNQDVKENQYITRIKSWAEAVEWIKNKL